MRILIFFILFTFNCNSRERINMHSTIDLTVRKAPDPVKPVDLNKAAENIDPRWDKLKKLLTDK